MINRLHNPLLCTSSSSFRHHISSSSSFQTPLFLRPLSLSTSPSSLSSFRQWAETLARSSGPKLSPNGPSTTQLLRELSWLIKDATFHSGNVVLLRTEIEDLYDLWRERIEERRPFQYIVGCEHWRDLVVAVKEGVLIPRPETEEIVDLVAGVEGFREGVWADLGTGSGSIAIGIGRLVGEKGRVVATDLSAVAVEVARFNVGRYNLEVSNS